MTPHPHAPALHALIDGEEVHARDVDIKGIMPWRSVTLETLCDLGRYPFSPAFYEWRLKPNVLRYRVAQCSNGEGHEWLSFVTEEQSAAILQDRPDFLRWAGDWQEVEA